MLATESRVTNCINVMRDLSMPRKYLRHQAVSKAVAFRGKEEHGP